MRVDMPLAGWAEVEAGELSAVEGGCLPAFIAGLIVGIGLGLCGGALLYYHRR
jgi:hypothetical protein